MASATGTREGWPRSVRETVPGTPPGYSPARWTHGPHAQAVRARYRIAVPATDAAIDAASTASRAAFWRSAVVKASPVMKSETVNPMPATAAAPVMCGQATSSGSLAIPRHGEDAGAGDPDQLAGGEAEEHAAGDRRRPRFGEGVTGQADTGVGEREDRNYDKAHHGVEHILDPFRDRNGVLGDGGHLAEFSGGGFIGQVVGPAARDACRRQWSGRCQQPERHPRERGVHTRVVRCQPAQDPEEHERQWPPDPRPAEQSCDGDRRDS